jgi:hypothetical protein
MYSNFSAEKKLAKIGMQSVHVLASESLACLKRLHVKQKGRKHIAT